MAVLYCVIFLNIWRIFQWRARFRCFCLIRSIFITWQDCIRKDWLRRGVFGKKITFFYRRLGILLVIRILCILLRSSFCSIVRLLFRFMSFLSRIIRRLRKSMRKSKGKTWLVQLRLNLININSKLNKFWLFCQLIWQNLSLKVRWNSQKITIMSLIFLSLILQ